ncbi:MAG: ACP S-malonyltransferase [Planctomycetes bacterium]|nr:ACP S-malonyltransferase [Planctomycetota bacterium]
MAHPLQSKIGTTAFAFRGYNVTNLGRTPELLAHPAYGPTVRRYLRRGSEICADIVKRPVDLVECVSLRIEPEMESYAEAVALIVAADLAQVQLLEEFHGVRYREARLAYGYSLGELSAVACGSVFDMAEVLSVPVAMADDCASLAANVVMGVLFSRGPAIDEFDVHRLCRKITAEGDGTIAMSAILSPNTYLLLGQNDTISRFKATMHEFLPMPVHMKLNPHRWPPMHTPIVRQKYIPDRAAVMMDRMRGGLQPPCPPVFSLVTGDRSYDDYHARDILRDWVDHPQRLWDAVYETLASGITTVIHVGPAPNVIPATFHRLSENVRQQIAGRSLGKMGMRAAAGLARRPWLSTLLPSRAALLRAPTLKHVILEDWLLEHGATLTGDTGQ